VNDAEKLWARLDDIKDRLVTLETLQDIGNASIRELRTDVRVIHDKGCSKANSHDDHEARLRTIEGQGRSAMAISGGAGATLAAGAYAFIQWIQGK